MAPKKASDLTHNVTLKAVGPISPLILHYCVLLQYRAQGIMNTKNKKIKLRSANNSAKAWAPHAGTCESLTNAVVHQ